MDELFERCEAMRKGMDAFGLPNADVNWQSIAVLLANRPTKTELIAQGLLDVDGGWATRGNRRYSDGTSLYLSPKGMAYWLSYGGHHMLYDDIMGLNQRALDRSGWLHISGGRVDIHCRITVAQKAWLDANNPTPNSLHARLIEGGADWRYYNAHKLDNCTGPEDVDRAPVPYPEAEPFDIRPVKDDDWGRLANRIVAAQERARHTELAD